MLKLLNMTVQRAEGAASALAAVPIAKEQFAALG